MSIYPDLAFITGIEITTSLNQEPSTRNVFNIREATIPEYEIAEIEPLPKNVTQNNERIFSNISKIFSKLSREKQMKNLNKCRTETGNKFPKLGKEKMNLLPYVKEKSNNYQMISKEKTSVVGQGQIRPATKERMANMQGIKTKGSSPVKISSTNKIEAEWKLFFEGPINKSIITNFFWYTLCVFKEGEEKKKIEEKFIEATEFKKSKDRASENLKSKDKLSDRPDPKRLSLDKRQLDSNILMQDRRYSSKDKEYMSELQMTQSKLLDNIAGNYIELNLQLKTHYKDKFFEIYYDCLAQAVFYCYFFAYPQSRNDILTEEFMNFLFRIISEQITGMPICNRGFESWSFDLGAGNILEKGKIKKSTLPALTAINEGTDKNSHLLHMRYSPLVNRFMKNRRYEGYNIVADWKMRYTLRNPKQGDIDKKMKDYTRLAMDTVKNTHERFNKYEEESKKIDDEISRNKAYIQKVTALMESRTQAILKHNSREYANLLVSLRGEWPTYDNE